MTVHYRNQCIYTKRIICDAPTETHRRKKQPRMIVRGWASKVTTDPFDYAPFNAIKIE